MNVLKWYALGLSLSIGGIQCSQCNSQPLQPSKLLTNQENFSKQEVEWQQISQSHPQNATDFYNLGVELHDQKRFEEAIAAYREAIRLKLDLAQAHNNLGIILQEQQKNEEAVTSFQEVIRLNPNDAEAYYNLGISKASQQKLDEAVVSFQEAIRLKPNFAKAYYNLGIILRRQQKLDEAVVIHQEAIRLNPNDAEAYYSLGITLADQQKWNQAVEVLHIATQLKPNHAYAHNLLGVALAKQQKLDEAANAFRKAIQLSPEFAQAWKNLGFVLAKLENSEEAVDAFRKAIKLKPNDAEAYYGLGQALPDQQLDDVTNAFRKAIKLKPSFAEAYYGLGIALQNQQKLDEAITNFRKAIQLKPEFPDPYINLGVALRRQQKLDEAVMVFRKVISLRSPYDAVAYNNLGIALSDQGKIDEAIAAYRKAIQIKPELVVPYSNLGTELSTKGEFEEAIRAFDKALELPDTNSNFDLTISETRNPLSPFSSSHAQAYNGKGLVFWLFQKNLKEAIANFEVAVRLEPNFFQAQNNLKEVERLQWLKEKPNSGIGVGEIKYLPLTDPQTQTKRSIVKVISWMSGQGIQIGTGWIIYRQNSEASIITNRHVIFDNKLPRQNIEIELYYGDLPSDRIAPRLPVRVVQDWGDDVDIAAMKVDFTNVPPSIQALPLVKSDSKPLVNQPVTVIGNIDFKQVAGRVIDNSQAQLILSFPLAHGYSGSPVLNSQNQVVGVIYKSSNRDGNSLAAPIYMSIQESFKNFAN